MAGANQLGEWLDSAKSSGLSMWLRMVSRVLAGAFDY